MQFNFDLEKKLALSQRGHKIKKKEDVTSFLPNDLLLSSRKTTGVLIFKFYMRVFPLFFPVKR